MAKINGIDVSHHQGTINWKQTASELRRVNGRDKPRICDPARRLQRPPRQRRPVDGQPVDAERRGLRGLRRTDGRLCIQL